MLYKSHGYNLVGLVYRLETQQVCYIEDAFTKPYPEKLQTTKLHDVSYDTNYLVETGRNEVLSC
jgi:hypothetical protein